MTYNSPYILVPEIGGILDTMERERALRNVRVRVANNSKDDGVGHIALTANLNFRGLKKGGFYTKVYLSDT